MREFIQQKAKIVVSQISDFSASQYIVIGVGLATFFFGFGAGVILNLYLLAIKSTLVLSLRSSLTFKSAIFGDGMLLPIVNMIVASFLLKNRDLVGKKSIRLAMVLGAGITLYFHINQAVFGLVNWAMPSPWHWNFIGLWHAVYMFSVASFLSLFYLVVIRFTTKEKELPRQVLLVTFGLIIFFILLRLDYISLDLTKFIPRL